MTNYISSALRAQISGVYDNIHETFQQTVTAYKDSTETVTVMSPSYNSIYGTGGSSPSTITKEAVQRSIGARIKYISAKEQYMVAGELNSQIKIPLPDGSMRIKVSKTDYDFIKEAKRIEFDGVRYNIVSRGLPIGPFTPAYYSLFLAPIDEDA